MRRCRATSALRFSASRMALVVSMAEQKMPPMRPWSSSSGVYEKLK
jgi:hypothetical protein